MEKERESDTKKKKEDNDVQKIQDPAKALAVPIRSILVSVTLLPSTSHGEDEEGEEEDVVVFGDEEVVVVSNDDEEDVAVISEMEGGRK